MIAWPVLTVKMPPLTLAPHNLEAEDAFNRGPQWAATPAEGEAMALQPLAMSHQSQANPPMSLNLAP